MADFLSRRWDLTDDQTLSHFNLHIPQNQPWRLCPLRTNLNLSLISALSTRSSEAVLMRSTPKKGLSLDYLGNLLHQNQS